MLPLQGSLRYDMEYEFWSFYSLSLSDVSILQGCQVYLDSLVGHVVNLCLSHHDLLRNNAVQILYSMIVSEYRQSEHFDGIENELVTRLDSLFMSDSKGDDISRAFFIGQLRHLFDTSDVEDLLRDRVSAFLDSVDLFLELLLSVRALPEGEEYADDRVIATVSVLGLLNPSSDFSLAEVDELHSSYWQRRDIYQICSPTRECK